MLLTPAQVIEELDGAVSRATFFRHVKQGKISATSLDDGSTVYDRAEVERYRHGLKKSRTSKKKQSETVSEPSEAASNKVLLESLQRELDSLKEQIKLKDEINEALRGQIRLLEHKPAPDVSDSSRSGETGSKWKRALKVLME